MAATHGCTPKIEGAELPGMGGGEGQDGQTLDTWRRLGPKVADIKVTMRQVPRRHATVRQVGALNELKG